MAGSEIDGEQLRWDESQQAVIAACTPPVALSVIGGPGTGKTSVLRECVRTIVHHAPESRVAVLVPDRRGAGQLRNELSVMLGGIGENLAVQSIAAFAFAIVSHYAQMRGRREPELIAGPDQDALIKDIFAVADEGYIPQLGADKLAQLGISPQAAQLPAFRAEIRDLITRAAELDVSWQGLEQLARRYRRGMWDFGAHVMHQYELALATQASAASNSPDRIDHARVITRAAAVLDSWARAPHDEGNEISAQMPHWDFIFIDDVHNATLAVRSLLLALQRGGTSIVTFGNPDQGVQSYRGGISQLPVILTKSARAGGIGADELSLRVSYRMRGAIAQVAETVTQAIPTAGVSRHRHPLSPDSIASENRQSASADDVDTPHVKQSDAQVAALSFPNDSQELAYIAQIIRDLHFLRDVPYSDIAVMTRSRAAHTAVRAGLARYNVPVQTEAPDTPLREQPAAAALLACAQLAIADLKTATGAELSHQIEGILIGRLGGLNPLELRILERRLMSTHRGENSAASLLEIWKHFASAPAAAIYADFPELMPLAAALQAARLAHTRGKTAAQVLWGIWQAFDVAEEWREVALSSGVLAEQANADLDAVIALFRVAQRLEERDIRTASIETLLSHLAVQDLPEDSVARSGSIPDAITLATPAAAVGRTWGHVIIMGLNEGVWPNTRLRNPLTHVPELVSVVVNALVNSDSSVRPSQLRAEVVSDELRLLLQSVSRARESLIFTCVHAHDVQPSRFLRWLTQGEQAPVSLKPAPQVAGARPATALVGELRQTLATGSPSLQQEAKVLLEMLAANEVRGANQEWWVDCLSTPMLANHSENAEEGASVSPSVVESMLSCPLRGFLSNSGGEDTDRFASADLGTLIHSIAEHHPHGSEEDMLAELDERWTDMNVVPGTISDRAEYVAAQRMIRVLADYQQQAPRGVLVEKRVRGTLGGITVHARLDRLEFDPDTPTNFVVADIKTGKSRPAKARVAEHPQLLIYQWLVNQQGVDLRSRDDDGALLSLTESESTVINALERGQQMHSLGAQLIYVRPSERTQRAVYEQKESGASEHDQAQRMIRATAALLHGHDFPALPQDQLCRSCAYQAMCPAREGERIFS